jgi:hypothetical protein|tara:strand:+ start:3702 stop:4454 length:753 start_codon:yes stop_codon:yes gene_type:complete
MSSYFEKVPKIAYIFGNENNSTQFQNLANYSDLIDTYRDDASAYTEYEIRDGERPDTLSYRLYEKSDYDWTFYLMNERLRETGWPMSRTQIMERAQSEYFKHYTCKLQALTADSAALFSGLYPTGTEVYVGNKKGTVVRKNLGLAEIVVSSTTNLTGNSTLSYQLPDSSDPLQLGASLLDTVYEYEGTHHYANDSGEEKDRFFDAMGGVDPVTNLQWLIDENDKSKRIRVIKKNLVGELVGELKRQLAND